MNEINYGSELAKIRWNKTTKKEKKAHIEKMNLARKNKHQLEKEKVINT